MKGLIALSLLVVMVVGGIGAVVTAWWIPAWGGSVIAAATGINLTACWLAFIPIAVVMRRSRAWLPQAVMGATGIRMLLASAAGWAACALGPWGTNALVIWLVVFYLALLAIETVCAVRLVTRKHGVEIGDGIA